MPKTKKSLTKQLKIGKKLNLDRGHWYLIITCITLLSVLAGGYWQLLVGRQYLSDGSAVSIGQQLYVPATKLQEGFQTAISDGNNLISHQNKTWIEVPGPPLEIIVVTSADCTNCPNIQEQALQGLRQALTPALIVRTLQDDDLEGQKWIRDFAINSLPAIIINPAVANFDTTNDQKFIVALGAALQEHNGWYWLQNALVGLPFGQFINPPAIADLETEPLQGNGPVLVTEFTDYECPFCKKLHDDNAQTIQQLVESGDITYVIKDFPLSFHRNARAMHASANCVLKLNGQDDYWNFREMLFANQKEFDDQWVQKTIASLPINSEDFASCVSDGAIQAEIDQDIKEGASLGISGTPGLLIGKQIISGAISPAQLQAFINDAK